MEGADLAGEVATDRAVRRPGRSASERFTVAAVDLGIKADDPAADGRARHRGARAAGHRDHRGRATRSTPTGCSSPTAPATRPPPTDQVAAACAAVLDAEDPATSGSASATRSSAARSGFGTYKLNYGHRGINQPVMDRTHRQGRGHRAQPRLRGRRAARRVHRHAVRPGRGQPRLPQRRRRRGAAAACDVPGVLACSTTPRPRPARTTPPTSSTASST